MLESNLTRAYGFKDRDGNPVIEILFDMKFNLHLADRNMKQSILQAIKEITKRFYEDIENAGSMAPLDKVNFIAQRNKEEEEKKKEAYRSSVVFFETKDAETGRVRQFIVPSNKEI